MRRKKKLEFKTKEHMEKVKKKKYFLIFSVFLLVFGVVSTLMFLTHYDFDLSNLFEGREPETAVEETTLKTDLTSFGSANFLAMCISDDAKSIRFISVINADLANKRIRVSTLSPQMTAKVDGNVFTLEKHFKQGGVAQTLKAVENLSRISIERYACSTDNGFTEAINSMTKAKAGKFAMRVEETINHRDDNFNLFISKGDEPTTFDGETLLKYFRYLGLESTDDGLFLQAITIRDMLAFFITQTNLENGEELFGLLYNSMEPKNINITGFDFNNGKTKIEHLLALENALVFSVEQKLTLFVKNTVPTTGEETAS